MKNFKLTIEYDGTNYFGWQRQGSSKKFPTVQGAIEKCMRRIFKKNVSLIGSGRTDTGVHAQGQVANFKVDTRLTSLEIQKALNAYLPDDILIKEVVNVSSLFHARYGVKNKWYRYTILNSNLPSVLQRNYILNYPYNLDISIMKKASKYFRGKHDFSKIGCIRYKNSVREIYNLEVNKKGRFIYIDVTGNGFLYKMVRRIVGMLIDVGRGKIDILDIKKIFSNSNFNYSVQTVKACGLCLMKVEY